MPQKHIHLLLISEYVQVNPLSDGLWVLFQSYDPAHIYSDTMD